MRVGDIAGGRAGDKGSVLDLSIVAVDASGYDRLQRYLTEPIVAAAFDGLAPGPVLRYPLPGLKALKFVLPEALGGGVHASMHAGLHWQKAAIWVLLDLPLPDPDTGDPTHG